MKRILFVFLALLSVFFIVWGVKANTLVSRPDNVQDGKVLAWYESDYTAPDSENEWYIDPDVPDQYIKMPGKDDIYMVTDENGKVISYAKRVKSADGNGYDFVEYDPNIPETYEKVAGVDNVYKVTDANGNVSYKKYIRNKDDNTFTFVDVDEKGNPKDQNKDATTIDNKHKLIDSKDNLYAVYDDNNVKIGYQKRVKGKDGTYQWEDADPPKNNQKVGNDGIKQRAQNSDPEGPAIEGSQGNQGTGSTGSSSESADPVDDKLFNDDGTYVVTTTETSSKTKDGYKYTYKTVTRTTYDQDGKVVHIESDKPVQIGKEKLVGSDAAPDASQIADTLDKELTRVSSKVTFNTSKANEIFASLNAARQKEGLPALKMDSSSDIYKIAQIRAADMAIYNHASNSSPMYGSTEALCQRYGVNLVNVTHNMWKTSERSASEINTRFMSTDGTREIRMGKYYGQVGIAVVDLDGLTYVIEVFAQ